MTHVLVRSHLAPSVEAILSLEFSATGEEPKQNSSIATGAMSWRPEASAFTQASHYPSVGAEWTRAEALSPQGGEGLPVAVSALGGGRMASPHLSDERLLSAAPLLRFERRSRYYQAQRPRRTGREETRSSCREGSDRSGVRRSVSVLNEKELRRSPAVPRPSQDVAGPAPGETGTRPRLPHAGAPLRFLGSGVRSGGLARRGSRFRRGVELALWPEFAP